MIERVHEHLLGELRQNTRTDTIFILVALLLNAAILGTNSAVGSSGETTYNPRETLTEGSHALYVEVLTEEGWQPAGKSEVALSISKRPERSVETVDPRETWNSGCPATSRAESSNSTPYRRRDKLLQFFRR